MGRDACAAGVEKRAVRPHVAAVSRQAGDRAQPGLDLDAAHERAVAHRRQHAGGSPAHDAVGTQVGRVEAGHQVQLGVPDVVEATDQPHAQLAPGRGDDRLIERRTIDAEEDGRFVPAIDDPHGHEDEAGAQLEIRSQQRCVDVGLLDLGDALAGGAGDGVLPFELDVGPDGVGPVVTDQQHDATDVGASVEIVAEADARELQIQLAVAADGGRPGGAGRGGAAGARGGRRRRQRRGRRGNRWRRLRRGDRGRRRRPERLNRGQRGGGRR
jgi:hypothetical protein